MNGISSSRNALIGLPALSDSSSAISSACSSIASASFSSAAARSPGVVVDQPANASRAALTARSTSCGARQRGVRDHLAGGRIEDRLGLTLGRIDGSESMKFWRVGTVVAMLTRNASHRRTASAGASDVRGRTAPARGYRCRPGETMDPASGIGIPVAFGAGLISFLSPCVLPLVPGYISAVAGRRAGGDPGAARDRAEPGCSWRASR